MGFVWAVRRSLRLLSLLTLMASALCTGQSLAAQEIAPPAIIHHQPRGERVPASEIFAGGSATTLVSATSPVGFSFSPTFAATTTLSVAPGAPAPLAGHFSPRAERAPPAA